MNKFTVGLLLATLCASLTANAARPSFNTLQTQVNQLNAQVNALEAQVNNLGPKKFVGFSSATLDGASGWPAINAACSSDFGSGARLCAAAEIYINGGPVVPMAPTRVRAYIHNLAPWATSSSWHGTAPCSAFTSANVTADVSSVLDSADGRVKTANPPHPTNPPETGGRTLGSCSDLRPVACCQ